MASDQVAAFAVVGFRAAVLNTGLALANELPSQYRFDEVSSTLTETASTADPLPSADPVTAPTTVGSRVGGGAAVSIIRSNGMGVKLTPPAVSVAMAVMV